MVRLDNIPAIEIADTMELKNKERIQAALAVRKQEEVSFQEKVDVAATEREQFLKAFESTRTSIIQPVFEEIKETLSESGHSCHIAQQQDGSKITIEIHPSGYKPDGINNTHPIYTISAGMHGTTVHSYIRQMMPNKGGSSGAGPSYRIEELTRETVENALTDLIAKCFGG